jgi:hypothetical protein
LGHRGHDRTPPHGHPQLATAQPVDGADILPLAFHVDYWDGLGWVDPFARPEFTQRQYAYGQAFKNRQVYTPQMIVAGAAEFGGYRQRVALREIAKAASAPQVPVGLHLLPSRDGDAAELRRFRIDVGPLAWAGVSGRADVALAVTEDALESQVARGENAGRRLRHLGVVRLLVRAGLIEQAGSHASFEAHLTLDPAWREEHLKVVAFVQAHDGLRIIGAARHPLRAPGLAAGRIGKP